MEDGLGPLNDQIKFPSPPSPPHNPQKHLPPYSKTKTNSILTPNFPTNQKSKKRRNPPPPPPPTKNWEKKLGVCFFFFHGGWGRVGVWVGQGRVEKNVMLFKVDNRGRIGRLQDCRCVFCTVLCCLKGSSRISYLVYGCTKLQYIHT